jgi:threonine dehydrogenase-like Zn-dependent dehydrogenase
VRPLAVARCDIDLFLAHGLFPAKEPFAIGHECVAEIVALGDAVRGLEVGQRVSVAFQLSCGECANCRAGRSAICERYPLLSDYGMQPLSGVEYGAMLSDLVSVPFANAMLAKVPGANPVSLASVYAVQAAVALGASRVDVASNDVEQLAHAERLGAHAVRTDFQEIARRYPIVVEGGLTPAGLAFAIRSTESEGICQSISYFPNRGVTLPLGSM